jgi:hypothetical protein
MTEYDDLCQAWFEEEPRRIAIDRVLRQLPLNMKEAISAHLAPPMGHAVMPTKLYNAQTAYVELYWPVLDVSGKRTWERCGADNCLRPDNQGIYTFHIGICIEKTRGSLNASMIYFTFTVEAFDDRFVELQIKNLDGLIRIDNVNDPASYRNAAKLAIDRLIADLRNPTTERWSRVPLGFTFAGNS